MDEICRVSFRKLKRSSNENITQKLPRIDSIDGAEFEVKMLAVRCHVACLGRVDSGSGCIPQSRDFICRKFQANGVRGRYSSVKGLKKFLRSVRWCPLRVGRNIEISSHSRHRFFRRLTLFNQLKCRSKARCAGLERGAMQTFRQAR